LELGGVWSKSGCERLSLNGFGMMPGKGRAKFSDRWKAAKQAGKDAAGDAFGLTRMMLKWEFARKVSEAGNPVRPVVAFHSERDLQDSIQPDVPGRVERLGIVFKHEFLCPDSDIESYTDLLRRAVDLARDDDFIKARKALYDWQKDVVLKGYTDAEAIGVMKGLIADYEAVQGRAHWTKKTTKFAFFVASLAIPVLREHAILTAGAALAADSGIKIIDYARSDHDDRPDRGLEAAAAIHTARQELSLRPARRPVAR
jgi:hypothetical protein